MEKIKELPITEDDIVEILMMYKPSLAKIFRQPVDLEIDEKGEIHAKTPAGGMSLEPIVNTSLKVVGIEDLKIPVAVVKIVEEWFEKLTPQERKALFYRYIDHDMRRGYPDYLDRDDWRVKYHTRSERQVARVMGITRDSVREYIRRGIRKILRSI